MAQAKGHTQATDVYSFGLVMWEILSGKVPFDDVEDPDDVRDMVRHQYTNILPCFIVVVQLSVIFVECVVSIHPNI